MLGWGGARYARGRVREARYARFGDRRTCLREARYARLSASLARADAQGLSTFPLRTQGLCSLHRGSPAGCHGPGACAGALDSAQGLCARALRKGSAQGLYARALRRGPFLSIYVSHNILYAGILCSHDILYTGILCVAVGAKRTGKET